MVRAPAKQPPMKNRPNAGSLKGLSENDHKVYKLIRSKENMGITKAEIRDILGIQINAATKSLDMLEVNKLIKSVPHHRYKAKKLFLAVDFEPSKEITGGSWYTDGKLDEDFIQNMKDLCFRYIDKLNVATIDAVSESINRSRVLNVECETSQIADIIQALLIDGMVEELKSTAEGEFASIPLGKMCYKVSKVATVAGALASTPCGVCPRMNECTPDGIISPSNCVYLQRWLDF